MGLDFGTSCSKVVIRTPFLASGRAVAVPFPSDRAGQSTYLVPTGVDVLEGGVVRLRTSMDEFGRFESLKVALMDNPRDQQAAAHAAAYLALLIRHSRAWFLDSQSYVLSEYDLAWFVNLGVPSAGYGDRDISGAFRSVLTVGKALADSAQPIRLQDARSILESADASNENLQVIPEIAAAVVGYARSSFRNPDLHFLIDAGASTLDVCGFILSERRGEHRYILLTAIVERRGVHELHQTRLRDLEARGVTSSLRNLCLADPFVTIPESVVSYLDSSDRSDTRGVQVIDSAFVAGCIEQIMACLIHVRTKRDPHSRNWESGVPVFLSGGGAHMEFYKGAAKQASFRCERHFQVSPLNIRRLPVPSQLANDDINEELFLRMAVAYGLSFDSFDIGEIVPPHEVIDVPPPRRRPMPEYISKDQV
jgi:hypothetical protein